MLIDIMKNTVSLTKSEGGKFEYFIVVKCLAWLATQINCLHYLCLYQILLRKLLCDRSVLNMKTTLSKLILLAVGMLRRVVEMLSYSNFLLKLSQINTAAFLAWVSNSKLKKKISSAKS